MTRTKMITGAASGIGKATAERLRAEGQKMMGVDLRDADITADLSAAEGHATLVEQISALSNGHLTTNALQNGEYLRIIFLRDLLTLGSDPAIREGRP